MLPEPASEKAPVPAAAPKLEPPIWRLDNVDGLDDWLAAHPASRLDSSAAPLWILAPVDVADQIAELMTEGATAVEKTFIDAQTLMNEAADKVEQIQKDDDIPVRATAKSSSPSKKQCRTSVQDFFHDEIMFMAADHPLWNQGRWTLIVQPEHIDRTWTLLAKSLAKGKLKAQGSVVALRARLLPASESTYDLAQTGAKRKKSQRSPTSSRHSHDQPLAIDVFFRTVWRSNVAHRVIQTVTEVGGTMPIFCKASLYSRLGIRSGHPLGTRSSLYTAKAMVSLAEHTLWTMRHRNAHVDFDLGDTSMATSPAAMTDAASTSGTSAHMPSENSNADTAATEHDIGAEAEADEPVSKKPRGDEGAAAAAVVPAVDPAHQATKETPSTQDEPMLPLAPRPADVAQTKESVHVVPQAKEQDSDAAPGGDTVVATAQVKGPEDRLTHQKGATPVEPTFVRAKEQKALSEDRAQGAAPATLAESQTQDESMTQIETLEVRDKVSAVAEQALADLPLVHEQAQRRSGGEQLGEPGTKGSALSGPSDAAIDEATASGAKPNEVAEGEPAAGQQDKGVLRDADEAAANGGANPEPLSSDVGIAASNYTADAKHAESGGPAAEAGLAKVDRVAVSPGAEEGTQAAKLPDQPAEHLQDGASSQAERGRDPARIEMVAAASQHDKEVEVVAAVTVGQPCERDEGSLPAHKTPQHEQEIGDSSAGAHDSSEMRLEELIVEGAAGPPVTEPGTDKSDSVVAS